MTERVECECGHTKAMHEPKVCVECDGMGYGDEAWHEFEPVVREVPDI